MELFSESVSQLVTDKHAQLLCDIPEVTPPVRTTAKWTLNVVVDLVEVLTPATSQHAVPKLALFGVLCCRPRARGYYSAVHVTAMCNVRIS